MTILALTLAASLATNAMLLKRSRNLVRLLNASIQNTDAANANTAAAISNADLAIAAFRAKP